MDVEHLANSILIEYHIKMVVQQLLGEIKKMTVVARGLDFDYRNNWKPMQEIYEYD
jgi:hypothetical protein